MATLAAPNFSIHDFLRDERDKDMFRFSTAGSVDDGKSTLIGRLLYDTQSVYDDQVRSIEGKGTTAPGQIDFALLTDGLRAEREQGITIDVAYRYFSTARRKFIIADTPGHEQYTRNMATGASTADAAVVLIDASKGVLLQSRRHAYIASLLSVRHVLVAVNKMDLAGYDEGVFRAIEVDFRRVLQQIAEDTGSPVEATFIPVSALAGDNIVHRSKVMAWYEGPSLLELLESLPLSTQKSTAPFRFPVQRVLRPDSSFRGFAGQIASGTVRPGDSITVLPSGRSAEVERIVSWDGDLAEACAPLSVTLLLNKELDISRGDLIVASQQPATITKSLTAALVWTDQRPLELNRRYLLKHTSHTVPVYVSSVEHRTDISTLAHEAAERLEMNGIGVVTIDSLRPIAVDVYRENRSTGAFILIDPEANSTVAAGMVIATHGRSSGDESAFAIAREPVSASERIARWGHTGGLLELNGPAEIIDRIERSLFDRGATLFRIESNDGAGARAGHDDVTIQAAIRSGVVVLVTTITDDETLTVRTGDDEVTLDAHSHIVSAVQEFLERLGILVSRERVITQ